jgi:tetratricopeptide (TPR) repeat protein
MSQKGKLTVEDLDRFLAEPLQVESGPLGAPPDLADLIPYFDAAAVLSAFDPFMIQPASGEATARERESLLDYLLPACEQVTAGPQQGLWSLSFAERRAALRRLATRQKMRRALDANPDRPNSPVQRMFERVMDEQSLDLASLSRDELGGLFTVIEWMEDILDNLPAQDNLRSVLARADLLEPMQRLVQHGFVNRQLELDQLHDYVHKGQSTAPLFVFGPGGVGKSTLLARIILQSIAPEDIPFAYIDIDRATVRPDQPLSFLIDLVDQLQVQVNISDFAESLTKEISFGIGRQEQTRSLESFGGIENVYYYMDQLHDLVQDSVLAYRTIVVLIDTFEEAQFLGPSTVWQLLEFVFELHRRFPTFRLILSGRVLPQEFLEKAFPQPLKTANTRELALEMQLSEIPLPERPINLGVLDLAPARELLRTSIQQAGVAPLTEQEIDDVIGIVSPNPMCLKLAARLLQDEGVEKLRKSRSEMLTKLKAEKIQALLYGRILHHLHNEGVRKVAYPGLIVRRITPDVIREVLAKPCGLKLTPGSSEHILFHSLSKEAALVDYDPLDGSLRHRSDVRRAMLEDLTDYVKPEVVAQIDRAAVRFYTKQMGAVARAEEIYHRLRLRQTENTLNKHWLPEAAERLKGAVEELPAQQRIWLASKLGITLDQAVRQKASQEAWEEQAERLANRYLQSGAADQALSVLRERSERLQHSRLYSIESEAYRFLREYDQAIQVARRGVDALSTSGDIDGILDLLLKMTVIEEGRGNLKQAQKFLDEAAAIAQHSGDEMFRLRVQVTRLRVQRQLRPDAREERSKLRQEALENVNERLLYKLRSYPVLLREVAAELSSEEGRIGKTAINTLGLEVATDEQAQALARALESLNRVQAAENTVNPVIARAVKQFQQAEYDPGVIRKWATTDLTTAIIRTIAQSVGASASKSETVNDFRDYFRVGVDSRLRSLEK